VPTTIPTRKETKPQRLSSGHVPTVLHAKRNRSTAVTEPGISISLIIDSGSATVSSDSSTISAAGSISSTATPQVCSSSAALVALSNTVASSLSSGMSTNAASASRMLARHCHRGSSLSDLFCASGRERCSQFSATSGHGGGGRHGPL
jgi:hypothetical protein